MSKGTWLKSSSVLGVELTPSQIKIVEAVPGPRLKILKAVSSNYFRGDQTTVAGQLRNLIKQEGFKSKSAHVAVSGPSVVHALVTLPILKKSEMQPVVEREIRKFSSQAPGELTAGFHVVGETTERGIRKKQVLIAGASRAAVGQLTGLMEEAGLDVQVVSIVPVAMLSAIQLLAVPPDEGTMAHLKLGLETSYIAIIRGGVLQFSREFPLGLRGATEAGAEFPDRLISEIKRTALYYRQNFRGEEIRRIVLSGDDTDLRRFTGPILDELGMEVSIYDPTPSLDLEAMKDGPVKFRETAHNFAVPLGLAWEPKARAKINVLPVRVVRREAIRLQRFATAVAAFVVVVGVAMAYFYLESQLQQRRERVSSLNSLIQSLQPKLQQIQEEERLREIQKIRLAFVQSMTQQGPIMAKALQEFSLLVPEEMLFRNVKVTKLPEKWQLTLDGEVVDQDAPRAQAIFNRFFSELRASNFFFEAGLLQPLQISNFEDTGTASNIPNGAAAPVPPTSVRQGVLPRPSVLQPRPSTVQVPGVIAIPVPERAQAAALPARAVRRSRVEFKLGISIASL